MSRYVTHKHGLVLGSDNIFFVVDRHRSHHQGEPELVLPEGLADFRSDYRAIVSFYGYEFDRVDMLNVQVRTPAQQLFWGIERLEWEHPFTPKGGETMMLPYYADYIVVNEWWERWLNENVGPKHEMWDVRSRERFLDGCVFFKRRSDALKLIRRIGETLTGIKYTD